MPVPSSGVGMGAVGRAETLMFVQAGGVSHSLAGTEVISPEFPSLLLNLEVNVRRSYVLDAVGILVLAAMPVLASAQSDDHGIRLAKRGLGQAHPVAINLSQDPNWLLYGFQRDGISYFQINDLAGRVHVIIGNADDVYWVLPAGESPARVSLPTQRIHVPASTTRSDVYHGAAFSLVLYGNGADAVWSVEVPAGSSGTPAL